MTNEKICNIDAMGVSWLLIEVFSKTRKVNGMHKVCLPKYNDVGTFPILSRSHHMLTSSFKEIHHSVPYDGNPISLSEGKKSQLSWRSLGAVPENLPKI